MVCPLFSCQALPEPTARLFRDSCSRTRESPSLLLVHSSLRDCPIFSQPLAFQSALLDATSSTFQLFPLDDTLDRRNNARRVMQAAYPVLRRHISNPVNAAATLQHPHRDRDIFVFLVHLYAATAAMSASISQQNSESHMHITWVGFEGLIDLWGCDVWIYQGRKLGWRASLHSMWCEVRNIVSWGISAIIGTWDSSAEHQLLYTKAITFSIHNCSYSFPIFLTILFLIFDLAARNTLISFLDDMRKLWPLLAQLSSSSGGTKAFDWTFSHIWTLPPWARCVSRIQSAVNS